MIAQAIQLAWDLVGDDGNVLLSFFSRPKDTQKQALLLHCAGHDVQDIFVTLSDPGPALDEETHYAKAMRLLDAPFITS